jgi:rare lipoprotein A
MRAVSLLLMLALGAAALQDEKPSPIVSKKRKATEKHEAPTKPVPDAGTAAPPVEKKPEPEKKAEPKKEPETPPASVTPTGESETGIAVLYPPDWDGRKTASGEAVDSQALTCSHHKHAMGTRLRVTNLANGRSVVVRVNDRHVKVKDRIVGLSVRAGNELGITGLSKVTVEVVR